MRPQIFLSRATARHTLRWGAACVLACLTVLGLPAGAAFAGPAFAGPAFAGPAFAGPAFAGPAFAGPAFDGPAFDGPAFDGPAFDGPAFDGPAFDGTAVTQATLQVSSLSASATQVTYTVNFDSPAALTMGTSTITLGVPSGTGLSGVSCYKVNDDANLPGSCGTATTTATSVVITSPVNVAAGDPVSVFVAGVANPVSAGAKTLTVATSADPTPVILHYTLAAQRKVTHTALHVSSSSAGSSGTTYSVTFASPDALTADSQITVGFPGAVSLPSGGCSQVNWTNDTEGFGSCAGVTQQGSNTLIITKVEANPGDMVTITFWDVAGPATSGGHDVTLVTTSDPVQVTLSYRLKARQPVSHPYLQLTSYAPGATGVTWTVGFTAPDRLVAHSLTSVIIKAPAHTVFPAAGCNTYYLIDASPSATSGTQDDSCASGAATGSTVHITSLTSLSTNPGDTIFVVIKGVQNPPSMTSIDVSTGADPKAIPVSLAGPTTIAATDGLSSTSASAQSVLYTETFVTTAALTGGSSTLTLSSPGATFSAACAFAGGYMVIDDTTGIPGSACPVSGSSPGSSITLTDGLSTKDGDEVTVFAYGVTNSAASGAGTFSVTTSPAAGGASVPIDLTARTTIPAPVFSVLSTSASAGEVAYSATFTGPNGFSASGAGDTYSTINLTAAPGTFPASGQAIVYNDNLGTSAAGTYTSSGSGATAAVLPGNGGSLGAGPGDQISVVIEGAANPSAAGTASDSLSTTSDPGPRAASVTFTGQTSVAKGFLQLSSTTPGASGVTYSFTFQAANRLSAQDIPSTITVMLPAHTGMPAGGQDNVTLADDTLGSICSGDATITGTTAVVQVGADDCPAELGAKDEITLSLSNVTNAPTLTGTSATLQTSSDPGLVTLALP